MSGPAGDRDLGVQPRIETERLLLRPFTPGDAPSVQRLAGDPAVADTTTNIPHPYEHGMAEAWIARHAEEWKRGEAVVFAVSTERDGLVGAIGLRTTLAHRHAELGYWIGKPFWNRGYATEAARAVLGFGFRTLQLNRIFAHHFTRNPASGVVMRKVGMQHEGTLRQHMVKRDRAEDLAVYGILREEFLVTE